MWRRARGFSGRFRTYRIRSGRIRRPTGLPPAAVSAIPASFTSSATSWSAAPVNSRLSILGHTRHHDGLYGLGVGFEFYPDVGCNVNILGFVAYIRDLEFPPPSFRDSLKCEFSLDIGRSADCRAVLDDNGRTDDRCVVLIDDTAFDRLGLGRSCRHTENRR